MASTRQLKNRIRSVGSTRQITKAMELVAASKMRRAQESSQRTQLYSKAAHELLAYLAELNDMKRHALFTPRPVRNRLLIVLTSNRGLAGAFNANVLKMYAGEVKTDRGNSVGTKTIAIGRKGAQFLARLKGADVLGVYPDFPEKPTGLELKPITNTMVEQFVSGEVDAVDMIYTRYVNSLTQVATMERILPAGFVPASDAPTPHHPEFEPSPEEVLEMTVIRLVEAQLFQALLDSNASEQSMRMVAMKNATDNAGELIEDLTLEMNKVRQADITQELAEISGGAEAMK